MLASVFSRFQSPASPARAFIDQRAAVSIFIAMSASMNCTPWNSAIAFELLAFLRAGDNADLHGACARPTAIGAPMVGRLRSSAHRRESLALLADQIFAGHAHCRRRSACWARRASPSLRSWRPKVTPRRHRLRLDNEG